MRDFFAAMLVYALLSAKKAFSKSSARPAAIPS
jgi:hypothetical protein